MFVFNLFYIKIIIVVLNIMEEYRNVLNMMEETFQEYRKIGKYNISTTSMQTYPCIHSVKFENGDERMMRGDKIYSMLHSEGLSDKYFDKYAEFVRKCDLPTPEEKREREEQELESKLEQEKYIKEQNEKQIEQQKIIDIQSIFKIR